MSGISDQLYREGTKLALNKQYSESLSVFNQVIELDPKNDQAWVAKGVVQAHVKQYNEAFQSFGEALKINPNNGRAKDNQDFVAQYIDLEMPKDLPMPDFPPKPSNLPSKHKYSRSYFLILWPFVAVFFWKFFLMTMTGLTAILLIPVGIFFVVLLSAIFLGVDASGIEAGRGRPSEMGKTTTWKPIEWGILTFLFLAIIYPLYLVKRRAIFEAQFGKSRVKKEYTVTIIILVAFLIWCALIIPGGSPNPNSSSSLTSTGTITNTPPPIYTVNPTANPTFSGNPSWGNFELLDYSVTSGDYGDKYIIGTVKNTGSYSQRFVSIHANFYDKDGNLLGNSEDSIDYLMPGDTWKFKIPMLIKGVSTYKIVDIS